MAAIDMVSLECSKDILKSVLGRMVDDVLGGVLERILGHVLISVTVKR